MSETTVRKGDTYEIRVKGELDPHWSTWFGELAIRDGLSGQTVLSGVIADQAALYGVLRRIFDLGLPLLAVNRVEPNDQQLGKETHCRLPQEGEG